MKWCRYVSIVDATNTYCLCIPTHVNMLTLFFSVSLLHGPQTVLNEPAPSLPPNTKDKKFSNELREFLLSCVHKNPKQRVPADILLGSPWFRQWGATGLEVSVENLRSWISR